MSRPRWLPKPLIWMSSGCWHPPALNVPAMMRELSVLKRAQGRAAM